MPSRGADTAAGGAAGGSVSELARSTDRPLDEDTVLAVVGSQFPELFPEFPDARSRWLGEGWDNELYLVGDPPWAFRFPKRAERVPWLLREIEIVRLVGGALGDAVRQFEYVGAPSELFPYPFVGYRFAEGVAADHPAVPLPLLAREIGSLLARLHAVDTSGVPPPPGTAETPSVGDRVASLADDARGVLEVLSGRVRAAAGRHVRAGPPPMPASPAAHRLCHHDLCAEHVIVDESTGRISAIIDWTDAAVADPVSDFVGLITIGGYEFIADVIAAYEGAGGAGAGSLSTAAIVWWCRTLTLTWLKEALEENPRDIDGHIAWVERALAEPTRRGPASGDESNPDVALFCR